MYEPCELCLEGEGRYEIEVDGKLLNVCDICFRIRENRSKQDETVKRLHEENDRV
jgi:ribosome-binding protein aMBF1 (putative translation factor)